MTDGINLFHKYAHLGVVWKRTKVLFDKSRYLRKFIISEKAIHYGRSPNEHWVLRQRSGFERCSRHQSLTKLEHRVCPRNERTINPFDRKIRTVDPRKKLAWISVLSGCREGRYFT